MDDFKNDDEQLDTEVETDFDEYVDEVNDTSASDIDFNVEVYEADEADDANESDFVDAEGFDPEEAPANAIVDAEEVSGIVQEAGSLADHDDLDELPDSIEIIEESVYEYDAQIEAQQIADKAKRSRRRLRNVLIFFIIILVLLGAAIGVFVWKNSTPPDIKQTDPEAMQTSQAGVSVEVFNPISADIIPDLAAFFGMTPEEAAEASGASIALDTESTPTTDEAMPELKSLRNAWVVNQSGDIASSITFGLNQDNKIIYTLASFDLDAYGVADAKFNELAASRIVAASILAGIGLDASVVDSAALSTVDNAEAITSRDTAGKEVAEFSGSTGRESAPTQWKISEIYDHTAGASLGDNSVIRTLTVDLR